MGIPACRRRATSRAGGGSAAGCAHAQSLWSRSSRPRRSYSRAPPRGSACPRTPSRSSPTSSTTSRPPSASSRTRCARSTSTCSSFGTTRPAAAGTKSPRPRSCTTPCSSPSSAGWTCPRGCTATTAAASLSSCSTACPALKRGSRRWRSTCCSGARRATCASAPRSCAFSSSARGATCAPSPPTARTRRCGPTWRPTCSRSTATCSPRATRASTTTGSSCRGPRSWAKCASTMTT
mmetsp:Transcript_26338/g.77308  ORF Transcript_26338/g.77308 Transcript_26338/m.77308 type:complete len:236 (+) Transcript_26338:2427-3134(+)